MNNTKTTLAIVAVLMAATLVVGVTFAATAAHSASAYVKKKPRQDDKKDNKARDGGDDKARDGGSGNQNGNTVTVLKEDNKGSASGFDTSVNQEADNLICTHPGENATCTSESE
jgi:hypothetical protein